jgi:alpha-N-arabinofuranosidase
VEIAEVNGPDIKAENDFGVNKVKVETRTTKATGRTLRHSFPPHSYTMLKVKLV